MKLDVIKAEKIVNDAKSGLKKTFEVLDAISLYNQKKVLDAFRKNNIALRHFSGSSGYGYGDEGRDALKRVYADVFRAEDALISPMVVSGTHAIALALFAATKRGDNVLAVSGEPYDTIQGVIRGEGFTLEGSCVSFDSIKLLDGNFDYDKIDDYLRKNKVDLIYIQRSRGYDEREALSVESIQKLITHLKNNGFGGLFFVDNCYGEFCETLEPTDVGADIIAGSLIKNIGGGIAPTGGYIVGKSALINRAEERLTAKTIAREVGSYAFGYREFFQGLFVAPHTVNQALKSSLLFGAAMGMLGFDTIPSVGKLPFDITRSIKMNDKDKLISFVRAVQYASPVDSFAVATPSEMPGYEDEIIMAAGCFIQGSSIELSCDAPIKPPYNVYIQGGLTFEHALIALREVLTSIEF